jgi:hypothetical protein
MVVVILGEFINVDRLDFKKYAKRPALAKALMDFILYVCECVSVCVNPLS